MAPGTEVADAYWVKHATQRARNIAEAKVREKAEKRILVEKKKKKKKLEYFQQLQNEVLVEDILLESTEGSQIIGSKHKKVTSEDKKAKKKKPEKYCKDTRVKIEGDNPYERCVCIRQNCLVHNSRWVNKFLLYFSL